MIKIKRRVSKNTLWCHLHVIVMIKNGIFTPNLQREGSNRFIRAASSQADCESSKRCAIRLALKGFVGDGVYDGRPTREAAHDEGAEVIVPPPRNAVPWDEVDKVAKERNQDLTKIKTMGRRVWEKETGYRLQGRAENTFYRYKRLFGGTLNARTTVTQELEVRLKLDLLNRMFALGKPHYLLSNPS